MAVIEKEINLIDEDRNLQISYTCMTDMLDIDFAIKDFELTGTDDVELFVKTREDLRSIAGTKDLQENKALFSIPAECFPFAGESLGQIRITRDGEKLYSNRIRMNIHPYYGGA